MIKKNLPLIIITSVIILIPMLAGLILWNVLPDSIAIHWNAAGQPDGFASKTVAVFVMPIFILAVHIICTFVTALDPKAKDISGKPLTLVLWICPVLSVIVGYITYATALGGNIKIQVIMPLVLGGLFTIIGNYLPKCKQNYTIGIKIPWTLNDENNWNKTHRFAGMLWVIGGLLIMATAFLGSFIIFFTILILMVIIPTIYSYLYYKKCR